ncbi:hypothetical protein QU487_14425 [Crenobacter sp. SG2305]|uniref:hypothetical protein n=1 Tax=Crenobacter oryzisoli TaxID=3056844 RepID=UPI0025AA9E30|nr:hypothetical protein [Crenobacter sp. SG2305]MDN0083938.1 hypothetical protein [Crenobacter sp. SG2305]
MFSFPDVGPLAEADSIKAVQDPVRQSGEEIEQLIDIYSSSHGDMAFTVPLFDEFMCRAIPQYAAIRTA